MARLKVEITDAQWAKIKPLLPKPKHRTGRPRADDRLTLEGIIWVLRSGARWRDMPGQYPSPSTCWRRLCQWEDEGVWEDLWRAYLTELDKQGLVDWDEFFADAAFVPAKKRGLGVGPTKRGKGTKLVVVASRAGVPFGIRLDSASPSEVNMLEPVMADVKLNRRRRPVTPQRLIVDRGYDADWLRWSMARQGIEMVCPHRRGRVKPPLQDGRALRRYKRRWIVERTIAWLTNYRRILVRHDHNIKM